MSLNNDKLICCHLLKHQEVWICLSLNDSLYIVLGLNIQESVQGMHTEGEKYELLAKKL